MLRSKHQRGFAIVEVLLLILIVGIIAFVAWRVIVANGEVQNAQNQVPQTTTSTTGTNVITPQKASDLTTLQQQLNNTTVDDNTAADLDTQTTY